MTAKSLRQGRHWPDKADAVQRVIASILAKSLTVVRSPVVVSIGDQAIVSATNFLTGIFIARSCGVEAYGLFAVAFTLVLTTSVLQASFSLWPYTVYRNRLSNEQRCMARGACFRDFLSWLALSLTFSLVYIAIYAPFEGSALPWQVGLAFAAYLTTAHFREVCRSIAIGDVRFKTTLLLDFSNAVILALCFCFVSLQSAASLSHAFLALAASGAISGAIWHVVYRRRIIYHRSFRLAQAIDTKNLGWWSLASSAPLLITFSINLWLVAFFFGALEAGMFAACNALVMIINPAITASFNVILPWASRIVVSDGPEALMRFIRQSTLILGAVLLPYCAFLWVSGDPLVAFVYGDQLRGNTMTILVIAMGVFLRSVGMPPQVGLVVVERASANAWINSVALAVNVVASFVLIPSLGIVGGALALALSEATATSCRWLVFCRMPRSVFAGEPA